MNTLHDRIELRTHTLFGTFGHLKVRRWPIWVGPMYSARGVTSYWQAWRHATGVCVAVFGKAVYIAVNR